MKTITINIPVPPRELRPNASSPGAWWRKTRMTKIYRKTVAIIAMAGPRPKLKEAEILFTLRLGKGCKQQDPDNVLASLKAAVDGLVDAGVLAGDRQIRYAPVEQVRDEKNPGVTVEVSHAK